MTSVQLTVGKMDAGMAILLTDDHHIIEFPSLLLPKGVASGSIVNISVDQNLNEDERKKEEFQNLQKMIFQDFSAKPAPPLIRVKNITQTTLILEWDSLDLKKAKLLSLEIYQNGAVIDRHVSGIGSKMSETGPKKLTGLEPDHEYEFYVAIKTTAGRYESNKATVRTHKMEDMTGIRVAFGEFEPDSSFIPELKAILNKIGASWTEDVSQETTHLLAQKQGGTNYEKANEFSIPIVKPSWLVECEKNNRLQHVAQFSVLSGRVSGLS